MRDGDVNKPQNEKSHISCTVGPQILLCSKIPFPGTSLVVQWLRICASSAEALVQSLVRKLDLICCSYEFACCS